MSTRRPTKSEPKIDVRPVDLALLAVRLSEQSGKSVEGCLSSAADLLAKAAEMLPCVHRNLEWHIRESHLRQRVELQEACRQLKLSADGRTLLRHCELNGLDAKNLTNADVLKLKKSIAGAKSRKGLGKKGRKRKKVARTD